MIKTVILIYLVVYILSAIYYQIEFIKTLFKYDDDWYRDVRGYLECFGFFLIGFIPIVNSIAAYKLFKTRDN